MSIENSLDRIASALELIERRYASYAGAIKPVSSSATPAPGEAGSKPSGSRKAKSTGTGKTSSTTITSPIPPSELSEDDVRQALKSLQKATDAAAARKILKDHGASLLKDLAQDQYQSVIDSAGAAAADEAE